jgi:hypothetical protein
MKLARYASGESPNFQLKEASAQRVHPTGGIRLAKKGYTMLKPVPPNRLRFVPPTSG